MAPFGGVYAWGGWPQAIETLVRGYGVTGVELVAELFRLNVLERSFLEIEAARQKLSEKQKAKDESEGGSVEGDLDDFGLEDENAD